MVETLVMWEVWGKAERKRGDRDEREREMYVSLFVLL